MAIFAVMISAGDMLRFLLRDIGRHYRHRRGADRQKLSADAGRGDMLGGWPALSIFAQRRAIIIYGRCAFIAHSAQQVFSAVMI